MNNNNANANISSSSDDYIDLNLEECNNCNKYGLSEAPSPNISSTDNNLAASYLQDAPLPSASVPTNINAGNDA